MVSSLLDQTLELHDLQLQTRTDLVVRRFRALCRTVLIIVEIKFIIHIAVVVERIDRKIDLLRQIQFVLWTAHKIESTILQAAQGEEHLFQCRTGQTIGMVAESAYVRIQTLKERRIVVLHSIDTGSR